MPIHDWSRIPAGLFHHFHQDWSIEIARTLNRGQLPKGMSALVEQRSGPLESDVLAIEQWDRSVRPVDGGVLLAEPVTQIVRRSSRDFYAERANRVVVRHHLGRIRAVIEIVSPGNKHGRVALRSFVDKTIEFLQQGIHVLVVDVLPPVASSPQGMHKAIWDELIEEEFELPRGKDRVFASYRTGLKRVAYVELAGLGDIQPDMPLYVADGVYVRVPLESTYQTAWEAAPENFREAILTGVIPDPDAD